MASRRSRKAGAAIIGPDDRAPGSEKLRRARTLRDLPTYAEPQDERATDPVILLEGRATTLPPPAYGAEHAVSLEHLAEYARRSAPPPRAPVVHRLVVPAQAPSSVPPRPSAERGAALPTWPVAQPSSMPVPPVARSTPPPPRAARVGERLRSIGTVSLSAGVGALVALGMWTVRSGFDTMVRAGDPTSGTLPLAVPAASAERCAPALAAPVAPAATPAAAAVTTAAAETRPVTLDALPLAQESATTLRSTRNETRASVSHRAPTTFARSASAAPASAADAPAAPRREARAVSPRTAVTEAVQRASAAARSCESGPQQGRIEVTFAPSGSAQSVNLIQGFGDTAVNGCVLRAFGRTRIPAFEGESITVRKTVKW